MNKGHLIWILFFLVFCPTMGCFQQADGVYCVNHSDCSSNICDNGVCVVISNSSDGTDSINNDGHLSEAAEKMTAVDILFVVDDSGSMKQEQEILASSIFSLMNQLYSDILGISYNGKKLLDVRVAVTNSDMGVSYDGGVYEEMFEAAPTCQGRGNNGKMRTEYMFPLDGEVAIPIKTEVIECSESGALCPPDWLCTYIDSDDGNGVCTPRFLQTTTDCPDIDAFLTEDLFLSMAQPPHEEYGFSNFVAAAACLAKLGTSGCAFEAPLAAVTAAFTNTEQRLFLRKNAMTVVILVTDEDDCSRGSEEWFYLPELATPKTNIVCGKYSALLMDINKIKNLIVGAKATATGGNAEGSILFAAITGVPIVKECQGVASDLSGCLEVSLSEGGTVGNPEIVEKNDPHGNLASYFEYACERYDDTKNGMVTQAYPARRIVQLAQLFGELGYVYSICNEDWTLAMTDIGQIISSRLSL